MKLITVTWNNSDDCDVHNHLLVRSFKHFNSESEIIKIHFNRNNYADLESEYSLKYGYQYEFLLYRIVLLKDKLKDIDCDNFIMCDTNDVICTRNINTLTNIFDLDNYVIFGMEKNQWPTPSSKSNWKGYTDYYGFNKINSYFLNAGCVFTKKENYIKLLDKSIEFIKTNENVLGSTHSIPFGGDQGVFTWLFNMDHDSKIKLDYSSIFALNTYNRSHSEYYLHNNRLYSKLDTITPCFIHDNGYHYGSPKYYEYFNLENMFNKIKKHNISSEKSEDHWGPFNPKDKVVLDIGCGVFGFNELTLEQTSPIHMGIMGAIKVIGIDGAQHEIEYFNSKNPNSEKYVFFEKMITSSDEIRSLINEHNVTAIKCDIDGEIVFYDITSEDLKNISELAIEYHSLEIRERLLQKINEWGFELHTEGKFTYCSAENMGVLFCCKN